MIGFSRFAKPVRPVRKQKNGMKGICVSQEYNGVSEGAHTIALGVCSIPSVKSFQGSTIDSPWYLLGVAVLKKILKKHFGANVVSVNQNIDVLVPPIYHTQSNTLKNESKIIDITFYRKTVVDGNQPTITSAFTVTMPIFTSPAAEKTVSYVAARIAENLQSEFGRVYNETTAGAGSNLSEKNTYELYGYSYTELLSMGNLQTDATTRMKSSIFRLDNMIVSLKYTSKIRIQNISPSVYYTGSGATRTEGFTTSLDNNEHNTLVGKVYHFSDPYPLPNLRILSQTYYGNGTSPAVGSFIDYGVFMKDTDADGIIKPNTGAVYNDLVPLRHIPTPDVFSNVKGYSLLKLSPGETKEHKMVFSFNGYINKLIRGLSQTVGFNGTSGTVTGSGRTDKNNAFGTCDLFCFEDYNGGGGATGATDPNIYISYQIHRFGKVKFVKQTHEGMEMIRSYTNPVAAVGFDSAT